MFVAMMSRLEHISELLDVQQNQQLCQQQGPGPLQGITLLPVNIVLAG